jgi:hypothetical protein
MPSVIPICIAAMLSVPRGSEPRKLMIKPHIKILATCGIKQI